MKPPFKTIIHDIPVTVVSDEEGETADVVVCVVFEGTHDK